MGHVFYEVWGGVRVWRAGRGAGLGSLGGPAGTFKEDYRECVAHELAALAVPICYCVFLQDECSRLVVASAVVFLID